MNVPAGQWESRAGRNIVHAFTSERWSKVPAERPARTGYARPAPATGGTKGPDDATLRDVDLVLLDIALRDVDLVLLDIKSWDRATYREVTGRPLQPTLDFAHRLAGLGKEVHVRFVLVPGLTDDPANVDGVAAFAASLGNVSRVDVLPFRKLGEAKWQALGKPFTLHDPVAHPRAGRRRPGGLHRPRTARGVSRSSGRSPGPSPGPSSGRASSRSPGCRRAATRSPRRAIKQD